MDDTLTSEEKAKLKQLKEKVQRVKDPNLSPEVPTSELPFGMSAIYWLDLRNYQPHETAKSIIKPMLIMQGDKDIQVTLEDFKNWYQALKDRSRVIKNGQG